MNRDKRGKRPIRIAIIVELKKREMSYLSILKKLLEERGYRVKFISFKNLCTWSLVKFRPDIILINGLRTTYSPFVSQIYIPKKLFKSKIVCYYVEQVGYFNKTIAKGYDNPLIIRNVDCHIAWGIKFAEDLINLGANKQKTYYIGSMQYDLDKFFRANQNSLRNNFSKQFKLDPESKWLIYCDNIMKRYTSADIYPIRRRESFEIIENIAKDNPQSIIIFRPHPESSYEEKKEIKERFDKFPNIIYNEMGHLFYWIMACDAMLIWQSTSAISAIFQQKPAFGFKTGDGQNEILYWYKKMIPTYTDHHKLVEDISHFLKNGEYRITEENLRAQEKYISDFFYKKDGYSFNRLISIIDYQTTKPKEKYKDKEFPFLSIRLLAAELKQFCSDLIRGRIKSVRINPEDELNELEKFDTSRYNNSISFDFEETSAGIKLVEKL